MNTFKVFISYRHAARNEIEGVLRQLEEYSLHYEKDTVSFEDGMAQADQNQYQLCNEPYLKLFNHLNLETISTKWNMLLECQKLLTRFCIDDLPSNPSMVMIAFFIKPNFEYEWFDKSQVKQTVSRQQKFIEVVKSLVERIVEPQSIETIKDCIPPLLNTDAKRSSEWIDCIIYAIKDEKWSSIKIKQYTEIYDSQDIQVINSDKLNIDINKLSRTSDLVAEHLLNMPPSNELRTNLRVLGEIIKNKRKKLNISREELADSLGVENGWLVLLENGYLSRDDIDTTILEKLAEHLDMRLFALEMLLTVEESPIQEVSQFEIKSNDKDGNDETNKFFDGDDDPVDWILAEA